MNNKGFTLVELLLIIALLSLVGITGSISIRNNLKIQEKEDYQKYIDEILSSADLYLVNNESLVKKLYTDSVYVDIPINDIISNGFLSDNLINPKTKSKISSILRDKEESINYVRATLKEGNSIDFEYPIKNKETEDYLEVNDIFLKDKENICYYNLNNKGLSYIKNGTRLTDYFIEGKNIKSYIKIDNNLYECTNDFINNNSHLNEFNIVYKYITIDNIEQSASRNIVILND